MPTAPDDLARRRALLTTALAVALLNTRGPAEPPEQRMMREWLDNWTGLGHVVTGMQRQGYRLHPHEHGRVDLAGVVLARGASRGGWLRKRADALAGGAGGGMERAKQDPGRCDVGIRAPKQSRHYGGCGQ